LQQAKNQSGSKAWIAVKGVGSPQLPILKNFTKDSKRYNLHSQPKQPNSNLADRLFSANGSFINSD